MDMTEKETRKWLIERFNKIIDNEPYREFTFTRYTSGNSEPEIRVVLAKDLNERERNLIVQQRLMDTYKEE